jgi:hypothetical protein
MALHRMVTRLFLSAVMILFVSARLAISQTEDPLSIRVESNLVLLNAEVYNNKEGMHQLTNDFMRCKRANAILFYQLRPSEPYLPKSCYESVIIGLRASNFHVFEDGIEQKIERVKLERWPESDVRDDLGVHDEWSHTPLGKWSQVDLDWKVVMPSQAFHFYQIAYVPTKSAKGQCHQVKVTVDRPEAVVIARDQYCYTEHPASDPLNGTNFDKRVEADLDSDKSGKIPLSLQANFFYADAQKARVDVVLEFPPDHLKHEWIRWELRAMIGVVGVIHRRNGSLAARFSDIGCCVPGDFSHVVAYDPDAYSYPSEYDNREELAREMLPSRYETQIELPAGEEYDLQVVLSDGKTFGRAKTRLDIGGYDGTQFAISSVALSNRFRDAGAAAKEAAAVHLAPGYVPLVSGGMQVTPSGDTKFKLREPLIAYYEIYEPLLSQEPKTTVHVNMKIVDAKSGETKVTFPPLDSEPYQQPGQTTIAIGNELKIGKLRKGDYRLEVQATDSAGRSTPWRTATFTIK